MMIQDVLTYLLIASATAYIFFSLYRMIYPSKKNRRTGCPGCSGCETKRETLEPKLQLSRERSEQTSPSANNFDKGEARFVSSPVTKTLRPRSYSSGSGSVPADVEGKEWVPRDFASLGLANRLQ